MAEMSKNDDRAKVAYDAFRGGFRDATCPAPHWDDAPAWVRDAVLVAYMQGTLDGRWGARKCASCGEPLSADCPNCKRLHES